MTRRKSPPPVVVTELYAQSIGGFTVAVRGRKVWLHPFGQGDGDLTPTQARALAAALLAVAGKAERAARRRTDHQETR